MRFQLAVVMILTVLTACRANQAATPIAALTQEPTPAPTLINTPRPTPTFTPPPPPTATPTSGIVWGKVCYPGSETPPMILYLQNTANKEVMALDIKRGQVTYRARLSNGEYIAYAHTLGMGLRGAYTCADSEEACPFQIMPGQAVKIDLCGWNSTPGVKLPGAQQPESQVLVRSLQNMHARTGPHLSEPELGLIEADTVLEVVGRAADHEWLLAKHPALNQTGWLHAPLMQVAGDPTILPIVGNSTDSSFKRSIKQFVPAIWRSERNRGIVLFRGEIRDQAGQPVNGYSILLDNGTWSVLSHPTGASHHYPDILDGHWDVVIDNETDAAGWWTMTVVRYECPNFEKGFNAQCKQFTPLSETKVIRVIHPDENIIEANWTCLQGCNRGLYIKAYRKPVQPIRGNWLLYIEDRALKSSPASPVFERIEMRTIYDGLPETDNGLRDYLANNRPLLSPDGRYLLVHEPVGVTWLADLITGELREISRPTVPAAWSPDSRQIAYLKNNSLYLLDIATNKTTTIWRQPDLVEPSIYWAKRIIIKTAEDTWQISPSGQAVGEDEPAPELLPPDVVDLIQQKLPPDSAWALSHDGQKVAYNIQVGGPLRNAIFLFDLENRTQTLVGPINGYRVPEIRWTIGDELLLIGATNPKFPSGGAIFTMQPKAHVLPEILLESDTAYLVDVYPELE